MPQTGMVGVGVQIFLGFGFGSDGEGDVMVQEDLGGLLIGPMQIIGPHAVIERPQAGAGHDFVMESIIDV